VLFNGCDVPLRDRRNLTGSIEPAGNLPPATDETKGTI
jgi:hypothetical protein